MSHSDIYAPLSTLSHEEHPCVELVNRWSVSLDVLLQFVDHALFRIECVLLSILRRRSQRSLAEAKTSDDRQWRVCPVDRCLPAEIRICDLFAIQESRPARLQSPHTPVVARRRVGRVGSRNKSVMWNLWSYCVLWGCIAMLLGHVWGCGFGYLMMCGGCICTIGHCGCYGGVWWCYWGM